MDLTGGSPKADHLCVLVHGLWGNPEHLRTMAQTIRAAHPEDKLHLLVASRNSGTHTYDGIERGGERLCHEIEDELAAARANGANISKISIVGYSMGGLVARYAIGLLHANGVFDDIEPVNFTTFASPHLGARYPLKGWFDTLWNSMGSRILSTSGWQLFLIDDFRGTGRPLLSILADPASIFMSGLRRFRRRTLYSNVTNDRTAVYYTTFISKTNPYTDMSRVKGNFVEGYDNTILDPEDPMELLEPEPMADSARGVAGLANDGWESMKKVPRTLLLSVLLPIGVSALLASSAWQTIRSCQRIRLHEKGLSGIKIEKYRVPLMIQELHNAVDGAYESLNNTHNETYLSESSDDEPEADEKAGAHSHSPTLALTEHQFAMKAHLDELGWRKYPVWIQNVGHSHAAIVRRVDRPSYAEGLSVLRHWVEKEFVI